jgi:hypothetical protein
MANLKFYKMAQAPVGTQEKPLTAGAVWFNTTNHSIEVWTGSKWEAYSGVLDAVVAKEILTITKYDGSTVSVDFSIYATDEALGLLDKRVGTLETTVGTHGTNIEGLQTRMGTVEGKAAAAEGQLAGLTKDTVMEEIAAQVAAEAEIARNAESALVARVEPLETASADYKTRIETLEGKFTGDNSVAEQIADAVEAAETRVDEKLATKADKKTYEDYVAANDERVAAAEKAIADETDRAEAAEALIDEKIGVPADVEGVSAYSEDYTVGMDIKAAKAAAAAAQKTIDDFLTGEGVDPNKVDALKDIITYMETHGTQYEDVVKNLGTLNTGVAGLKEQVGTGTVDSRIATAKEEAVAAANGYADDLIEAEVERAEAAYEKIGVAAGLVKALEEGAVATNATAISGLKEQVGTGTVDSRIATAKSEAITAAGEAADQKIADLKLAETYEKVGVAKGLVDALAEGAVAGNTAAIAALDAKVTEGLSWVVFEE